VSPRRWKARVEDILAAIDEIHSFVEGMGFDEFRDERKTLRAVVADFIIVGEAAANMPDEVVSSHPEVPWPVLRGMRNALVHAYFDVDPRIVWDTIQQDLPSLIDPLRSMLEESDDTAGPS
jgi:uncharacterized protein with HEPN domain